MTLASARFLRKGKRINHKNPAIKSPKLDDIKTKKFCSLKDTVRTKRGKMQPTE